jgi:hypothetical protein
MAWLKVHQYAVSLIPGTTKATLYLYVGSKTDEFDMTQKEKDARFKKTIITKEVKLEIPVVQIAPIVDLLRNEKGLQYNDQNGFLWSAKQDVGVGELTTEGTKFFFDKKGNPNGT